MSLDTISNLILHAIAMNLAEKKIQNRKSTTKIDES